MATATKARKAKSGRRPKARAAMVRRLREMADELEQGC